MLHRRALAPALSLVLAAGGVALTAAPATADPPVAVAAQKGPLDGILDPILDPIVSVLTAVTQPLLSGTGAVGEPLNLTLPTYNVDGVQSTVQWLVGGTPVPGATGTSFTPTPDQVGKAIQAQVTGTLLNLVPLTTYAGPITVLGSGGTGGGGTGGTGGTDSLLTVLKAPYLDQVPAVGSLLTLVDPVWSLPGVQTTYEWFVGGLPVPGATGPTYVPSIEDAGKDVYAKVTGALAGLPVVSAVTAALPIPAAEATAVKPTSAPTVTGTAKVGKPVTVQDPTWDQEGVSAKYQWMRDGAPITGATGKTYLLAPEDLGRQVAVKVTGHKEGFTDATVDSNAVSPTLGDAPGPSTQPTVSGTYRLGQTLTAVPGAWGSGANPTFTYQWKRGTTAIPGATAATYVVTVADLGQTLSVTVTATRPAYQPGVFTTSALPVAKQPTSTTLSGPRKVRAGKAVRVLLGVVVDGVAPDGVVTVMDGAKQLRSTKVPSGRTKLKLSKLEPGKHKLTAVYAGSSATEGSTSRVLRLKVLPRKKR